MDTNSPDCKVIQIYLLVQNRLVREAVIHLFRRRSGFVVVGDSQDTTEALDELERDSCDILLLNSIDALHTVGQRVRDAGSLSKIKFVLFGMKDEPDCFLRAVRWGVSGYLLNDTSAVGMVAAVRSVAQGEAVCPPKLCKTLFEQFVREFFPDPAKEGPRSHAANALTCRQRQLMVLVATGMSNKEIAASLQLSEFTVKNHIHRIMAHLQAENRHQAVDVIRTSGLLLTV